LVIFMRLSLKKGAHAALSGAACRKFGASRSFFARCGIRRYSMCNSIGVIRSAAEGSAVPRTFPGNVFRRRSAHNCHPDLSAAHLRNMRWQERGLDPVMWSSPSSRTNSNSATRSTLVYTFCLSPSSRKPRFHAPRSAAAPSDSRTPQPSDHPSVSKPSPAPWRESDPPSLPPSCPRSR
jgi:hypothetical protein